MWILGSFKRDLSIFHISGFLVLLFYLIFKENLLFVTIWSFVFFQLIDIGHNYSTFWRTLFKKSDNPDTRFYWLVFAGCFLFISTWLLLGIPYYFTFVLYFIFWHHVRQFYGINRWYQRLNNRFCKASNYYIYLLTFTPFIFFHFRVFPNNPDSFKQLFTFPNQMIFNGGFIICMIIFVSWIVHEITLYRKGIRELNRFLSLAVPAVLHIYCFLFSASYLSIFFPLLAVHGLSYLAIMGVSLDTLNPKKNMGHCLFLIGITVVVFGVSDYFYKVLLIDDLLLYGRNGNYLFSILLALKCTASLFHCIVDGFLWNRKNPEAKKIIASTG